nr:exopolysaccharide Pel transporter PelG [Eubacterium sp.]
MAGIGVKLKSIYDKNTLTTNILGMGYSTVITIAPMVLVIAAIMAMQIVLQISRCGYSERELFACTVLYIFIFALLTASPFNSVLSRYMSDVIYEERYQDILPCFYTGMIMNVVFSSLFGIPFCVREYLVSDVSFVYVFAGYCGYIALVLVFYQMLYLSICKDYKKISFFFLVGMLFTLLVSLLLVYVFQIERTFSMLVALDFGFLLIAALEIAVIRSYFHENSGEYKRVLHYFKLYWKLVATNFLYTLGLYIHNFVFWTTDLRMVVANTFVSVTSYDLATCLAMFTNISSSVIFISRVEMYFHERYKAYSEAVIGGRDMDIELTKNRMFRQLAEELMNLVRIQFIVSVILFFVCIILLPQFGFGGMVMKIYPCLAAGYFILFVMYAAIIFLYYFNDLSGALATAIVFCSCTMLGSIVATHFSEIWYGIGVFAGSFLGFCVAYFRLKWLEGHLDEHIFCRGTILQAGHGKRPASKVFDRYAK